MQSQLHSSFALTHFPSRRRNSSDNEGYHYSKSNGSFFRRQLKRHEEQEGNTATLGRPGIFGRIARFMSHTPLLSSAVQANNFYGVVPDVDPAGIAEEGDDGNLNQLKTNTKNGKSSALGMTKSARRPSSRQHVLRETSSSHKQLKTQGSKRTLDASDGSTSREYHSSDSSSNEDDSSQEMIFEDDGNTSSWSEDNPPDNSL